MPLVDSSNPPSSGTGVLAEAAAPGTPVSVSPAIPSSPYLLLSDVVKLATEDYRNPASGFYVTLLAIVSAVATLIFHHSISPMVETAVVSAAGFIATLYTTLLAHRHVTAIKTVVGSTRSGH